MELSHVSFEERESIATLSFTKSERRNPLSLEVMLELRDALRAIGASKARGVVLAASGPVFCAGHDYADLVNRDLAGMRQLLAVCTELMTAVQSIPQPVVARVQGLATGAGCQLVAACDLAVASEDAEFQTPGGAGGLFCTTPMVSVSRAIGRKRALELLFTGDKIDARTAAEWGLVNRVVPAAELLSHVKALAASLAAKPPIAIRYILDAVHKGLEMPFPQAQVFEATLFGLVASTDDMREGTKAFLEKRKPTFQGR